MHCGTVRVQHVNSRAFLCSLSSCSVSCFCLFLHFRVLIFLLCKCFLKTFMYSMWSGQVRGSCQAQPFRCACVCMCASVCMNLPVTVCLYVTHLCLTGKPHSSRLGAKGERCLEKKKKAEVVYYKALHSHTPIS